MTTTTIENPRREPWSNHGVPDRQHTSAAGAPQHRYGRGFWLAAGAFLAAMAFSTVPTPLYVLYQRRDDFSSFVVTVVFAVYALGVIASLLLAGHLSDRAGRRRVLVPALAIELVAAGLFLVWPALPGLIVARFVSGLGVGMVTSTATAQLRDLHALERPGSGAGRFEVVSTGANLGGLGIGTLASGSLAQLVGHPLTVPFAVFAGALVLAIIGATLVPETVERPPVLPRYRPQRVSLGGGDRGTALMSAAGAFAGFAVFGLFTSLAPAFIGTTLGDPSRLLAGLAVFIVFAAAALAQGSTGRLTNRARLLTGIGLQTLGLVVLAASMEIPSLAVFSVGGGLAGAGAGVLFKAALAAHVGGAEPARRGEAASALFLAAYLGLIVPVVGVGTATLVMSAKSAMLVFSAALIAIMAAVTIVALRRPRRPLP